MRVKEEGISEIGCTAEIHEGDQGDIRMGAATS